MPAAIRPPHRRAFTLIELVVVIVVIGILAGIAAVSYHTVMSRTSDEVFLENQRNVAHDAAAILAFRDGTSPSVALAIALAEMPASADAPGTYAAGCTFTPQDRTAPLGAIDEAVSVCGWTVTQTAAPATPQPGQVTWQAHGTDGINFQAADTDAPHVTSCVIATTASCTSAGIAPPADPTTTITSPTETAPLAPQSPSAVAGSGQATVSFAPPANDGGAAITTYTVTSNPGGLTASGSSSPITVPGLTNGISYTFSVTATNTVGTSAPSAATSPVTPIAKAGQVQHVTAVGHAASIAVSWDGLAGTAAQPLTGYRVFVNGTLSATVLAGTTSATLNGLTNGTTYNIEVAAYGPAGQGTASDTVTATPTTAPDAPANVELTAGVARIDVTWDPVADTTGAPITGYRVYVGGVLNSTVAADTTSIALTTLAANTAYTVQVTAYGPAGESAGSTPKTATTFAPPATPVNVQLTVAPSQLGVSWDAVAATATAPVAGYRIYVDGVLHSAVLAPTTSTTLASLTNGTTYTVQVAAYGDAGESDASTPNTATPIGAPEAPVSVSLAAGDTKIDVSWSTVADTLGAPVTGYRVFLGGVLYGTYATPTTTATIDQLTNGTTYAVQVATYGPAGQSSASATQYATPMAVPGAPTAVHATDTSVTTVTWTAPGSDGGSPITGYSVTASAAGQTTRSATADASATSTTVGPLNLGVTYTISVVATNAAGTSTAGTTTALPIAAPAQVTGLNANAGDTTIDVSWLGLTSTAGQPVTGYRIYVGGVYETSVLVPTTSATLASKTNGTTYSVQVAAYGPAGQGTSSNAVLVTPRTVPDSPTLAPPVRVSPMTSATVSWTAPTNNGGATITSYKVLYSDTGATWTRFGTTFTSSPVTVTGLNPASSYYFQVVATNAAGDSAPGISLTAVSGATAPAAPTAVGATSISSTSAQVTWTAPSNDGGSTITDYQVSYATSTGGTYTVFNDGVSTGTTATVSGLTLGTTYYFKVAAINAAGTGPSSLASAGSTMAYPYTAAVLNDSPWLWYRYASGDSATVAQDSSGNARTSSAGTSMPVNQVSGPISDGSTSTYASTTSGNTNGPTTFGAVAAGRGQYSIEAWVNPTSTITSLAGIVGNAKGGFPNPRDDIDLEAGNGYVQCDRFPSTTFDVAAGPALTPGVWTHLVCTYDGTTLTLYINGAAVSSNTSTVAMGSNSTTMSVSNLGTNVYHFPGKIAEVALYSTALSASSVQNHFMKSASASAPPAATLTGSGTSLTVTFPSYGAGASYTATAAPGGATCTTSSSSCTLTGLAPVTSYTVTYRVTVGAWTSGTSAGATGKPGTYSFALTGAAQTFTVPAGVSSFAVTMVGGQGGNGTSFALKGAGGSGGYGAQITGNLAVTAGDTISVYVAGGGSGTAGGWGYDSGANGGTNGGGGGGGSTAIVKNGTLVALAGGGGGGGAGNQNSTANGAAGGGAGNGTAGNNYANAGAAGCGNGGGVNNTNAHGPGGSPAVAGGGAGGAGYNGGNGGNNCSASTNGGGGAAGGSMASGLTSAALWVYTPRGNGLVTLVAS